MPKTKVIEYDHEYDEDTWEFEKVGDSTQKVTYVSHNVETYYAIQEPEWTYTDRDGKVGDYGPGPTFKINGTDLHICNKEELEGYIGLLRKLREEFSE